MIKNSLFIKSLFLFFFLLASLYFFPKNTLAVGEFITTWKTDNPGSSASNQIVIPTAGGGYNYTVDWGDGSTDDTGVTGDITHTYSSIGTYTVTITGAFPRIYFNNTGDKEKILSVEQWGNISWASMENAFWGASNLVINATDAPDLSGVTTLSHMFSDATSLNQNINSWNVSTITDMNNVFTDATSYNQPLNNWNVSNVTLMYSMFNGATSFNQNLSSWDVADVTDMSNMFYNTAFNQNISSWSVANVTSMIGMFASTPFNQNIGPWNVASVMNMNGMFQNNSAFNQNISSWNVASVMSMNAMFDNAISFNQPLNTWNVGNVTNMEYMFHGATSFNRPLNSWDVSDVTNMAHMFHGASSFDQNLSAWSVANVTDMQNIFNGVTLSTSNYDLLLISWSLLSLQANVIFDGGNSRYCSGNVARTLIITLFNWNITDGGILNAFCLLGSAPFGGPGQNSNNGEDPPDLDKMSGGSSDDWYNWYVRYFTVGKIYKITQQYQDKFFRLVGMAQG